MAVDYTKVFTILGVYADKIRDYYAYIATHTSDKAAIETILTAQSAIYLEDGLTDDYDGFKQSVSDWIGILINRMENVLTDETLIGANFPFGSRPNIDEAMTALIHDMTLNDKNVVASVATVGSVSYVTANTLRGVIKIGTTLDGYTAPMDGAIACADYAGLTTQLTPDSETITLTCITDSENGGTRGSEVFSVKGTSAFSGPYSPNGENIGILSNITVADNTVSAYLSNASFDSWDGTTTDVPDSWELITGTAATHFEENASTTLYSSGSSLQINGASGGQVVRLEQTLDSNLFTRHKSYWISGWARKLVDTLGDAPITIVVYDDNFSYPVILTPTSTAWTNYAAQVLFPDEIVGDLKVAIKTAGGGLDSDTENAVLIDQIVLTPCQFMAGVTVVVFGGPEKWLVGDTATFTLSNNSAGKFQSVFRKALRVQLPTDATPTISDSLVA